MRGPRALSDAPRDGLHRDRERLGTRPGRDGDRRAHARRCVPRAVPARAGGQPSPAGRPARPSLREAGRAHALVPRGDGRRPVPPRPRAPPHPARARRAAPADARARAGVRRRLAPVPRHAGAHRDGARRARSRSAAVPGAGGAAVRRSSRGAPARARAYELVLRARQLPAEPARAGLHGRRSGRRRKRSNDRPAGRVGWRGRDRGARPRAPGRGRRPRLHPAARNGRRRVRARDAARAGTSTTCRR